MKHLALADIKTADANVPPFLTDCQRHATHRRLSFFLAMEEHAARRLPPADYFFLWQIEPTVIIGRNQVLDNEVNMGYCREHGIDVFRRKSGGGCVYADMGNVMLSFVTPEERVGFAYNRFLSMVLMVFRKLGIEAVGTRHNDILVDGRKVCGTACYHLDKRCVIHSTLLYDTNMEHMRQAITPSSEKLQKRGIESVRQRITLLKDHTTLTLEELKSMILQTLCDDELLLSNDDMTAISQLEQ